MPADGVWGHRKRAGRAAPEHWTGPQISIIRRALGDPGEDREGLRRGEAAARGRETRTALRHHGTATRKALAEDPVGELAAPDAARLHAQQLAGGGRGVDAVRPGHACIQALLAARLLRRPRVTARDRAAGREDGLHVAREADLRRAWRAGEQQLVPVALAARGRGDGEVRFAGFDPRERKLERQAQPWRGAGMRGRIERVERSEERLPRGSLARRDRPRVAQATLLTLAACSPFGPCVTSNWTRCPSSRVRKPEPAIAE